MSNMSPSASMVSMPGQPRGRCRTLEIERDFQSEFAPPDMRPTRSVDAYERNKKVGEGTYGAVFLATEKATGEKAALKLIKLDQNSEREGFPITSLREIRHLFKIAQSDRLNVVQLKEIVYGAPLCGPAWCADHLPLLTLAPHRARVSSSHVHMHSLQISVLVDISAGSPLAAASPAYV